jgi:HSP20 family protein
MTRKKSNNQPARTKSAAAKNQQVTRLETDVGLRLPAPGNLVRRFRDEMDRLFEDFGFDNLTRSLPNAEALGLGLWAPEVEIFERAGEMVVRADLPGMNKEDIRIDLTDRAITIDGERRQEHEKSDNGYYRSERSYGRFYRRIPLPESVDIDTAKAYFRDGVLEVTFAVSERKEHRARKLEVSSGPAPARAKAAGR